MMGGMSVSKDEYDTIHKYSLLTQKWVTLDIKLPYKMGMFAHVLTKEQRYIIILDIDKGIFMFDLV